MNTARTSLGLSIALLGLTLILISTKGMAPARDCASCHAPGGLAQLNDADTSAPFRDGGTVLTIETDNGFAPIAADNGARQLLLNAQRVIQAPPVAPTEAKWFAAFTVVSIKDEDQVYDGPYAFRAWDSKYQFNSAAECVTFQTATGADVDETYLAAVLRASQQVATLFHGTAKVKFTCAEASEFED